MLISNVASFRCPRDACRFSVVSSLFRSAAESDIVWERFLPPNYESIVARSPQSSTLLAPPSKKQLYVTLCNNPILIDNGRKTFWLDKWSGKKCYTLSARDLAIVWGDAPPYWRWSDGFPIPLPELAVGLVGGESCKQTVYLQPENWPRRRLLDFEQ